MQPLSSPIDLIQRFPTPSFVASARSTAKKILEGKDSRLAVLVGPCSIHDPVSALEFGEKLKKLSVQVEDTLFLIMRCFIEKPRTRLGWKGMVYDPFLDGSYQMEEGLHLSRSLLSQLGKMEVPCCMEFLDPLMAPYMSDLVTWGLVGARTVASQPHRQMASGFSFPLGFKNDIHGNLDVAIDAILSARHPHFPIGINKEGKVTAIQTKGNLLTHLVLRGSEKRSNYDPTSVAKAAGLLKKHSLLQRLLIDCSHGNSSRDAKKQKISFTSVIEQLASGTRAIGGLMLESNLFEGKQSLTQNQKLLQYGVSITDPCLSWEDTESLLLWAHDRLVHINPLSPKLMLPLA
jgi:3-deoxy-7-phosphoheptulonate synthase